MPRLGPRAGLAALALTAGCAGFVDDRMLPWYPPVSRTLVAEDSIVVTGRRFELRRYREERAGMGVLDAFYVVTDARQGQTRTTPEGLDVTSGVIEGRLFFTNFPPGEWYCGATRDACVRALMPEQIPRFPFPEPPES